METTYPKTAAHLGNAMTISTHKIHAYYLNRGYCQAIGVMFAKMIFISGPESLPSGRVTFSTNALTTSPDVLEI